MKALTITALSVAVAIGTYVGLTVLMPHQKEVAAGQDNAEAIARVFGGTLQEAPIEPETVAEDSAVVPATVDPASAEAIATSEEPAAEPEAAEAPTEPVAEAPVAEPEPAPAPAAAAPEPAPAKAAEAPKPSKPAAAKSTGSNKNQNPAPTWWGRSAPGSLNLVYAGSAAYKRAIVLMFDGDFKDAGALNRSVKVTDANGKAVSARWEINDKNPRMAVLPLDAAGTYRVSVPANLKDAGGRMIGTAQQGPVQIP